MSAAYRWDYDPRIKTFYVFGKGLGWYLIEKFVDHDLVLGRKRAEAIIENEASKSKVVSYLYDSDGRQLTGFEE